MCCGVPLLLQRVRATRPDQAGWLEMVVHALQGVPTSFIPESLLERLVRTGSQELPPVCAIVGGILGQVRHHHHVICLPRRFGLKTELQACLLQISRFPAFRRRYFEQSQRKESH